MGSLHAILHVVVRPRYGSLARLGCALPFVWIFLLGLGGVLAAILEPVLGA